MRTPRAMPTLALWAWQISKVNYGLWSNLNLVFCLVYTPDTPRTGSWSLYTRHPLYGSWSLYTRYPLYGSWSLYSRYPLYGVVEFILPIPPILGRGLYTPDTPCTGSWSFYSRYSLYGVVEFTLPIPPVRGRRAWLVYTPDTPCTPSY